MHVPGHGWWYAVTVIEYYSRYLLACHFTPSYRAADVALALDRAREEAERHHGPLAKTPFLVTDNGSSFLAKRFQRHIDGHYAHVRINYRTPTQLGLLERFHQTMKTEEIYWHLYQSPAEARERLAAFRERYNTVRPHWALRPEGGGGVGPVPWTVRVGRLACDRSRLIVPPSELAGALVPEAGVESLAVVEDLDEVEDGCPEFVLGAPALPIEQLRLQGGVPGFDEGVGVHRQLLLFATMKRELFG